MKKIFIFVLAIILSVSIFAGCTDNGESTEGTVDQADTGDTSDAVDTGDNADTVDTEEPEEEGYLKLYWEYINETGDGWYCPGSRGNYLETNLIWSNLIRFDQETGEMIYLLADDISVNDDATVYTVKLKEDVVWHDGTPLSAADVVFTYNAAFFGFPTAAATCASLKDYEAAVNGEIDELASVYATDDHTVVFELGESNLSLLSASTANIFSFGLYAILPAHLFEGVDWADFEAADYWTKPIGTGPYMVDELAYPEYCTLVRFDDYFGQPAGIKNIVLTAYTDLEAAFAAALAGDLDLIRNVPADTAENIVGQNSDCEIAIHNAGFTRTLLSDVKHYEVNSTLLNANVRKAFSLIIDKLAIADYLGLSASVATNYNNDSFYNSDIPTWKRDVEKGVQMLEAEGYDFNDKVRMLAYYTDQATVDIFDIIVSNLAEAGITAEYVIDDKTTLDQWATGEFDFMYAGVGAGTTVYSYYGKNGLSNDTYLGDFEAEHREFYDKKWLEYQNTVDVNGKKEISGELQLQYMEDMYGIPLYFLNTVYLVNSGHLQGYAGISTDYESYAYYAFENWVLLSN